VNLAAARCGVLVVNIDTGNILEWLRFEHAIDERYDVAISAARARRPGDRIQIR
jgi:hypothetical protein